MVLLGVVLYMLDWRGIIGLAVAGLLVVMGINPSQFLRPGLSQSLLPVIFLFAGLSLTGSPYVA